MGSGEGGTAQVAGARPLRVLHCLYDVAGNAGALAKAERSLGLESTAVTLVPSAYGFATDEALCRAGEGYVRQEAARWGLVARAVRHADVVHFNFGRSIMPPWKGRGSAHSMRGPAAMRVLTEGYLQLFWLRDLPLFKALGKAMFVTFQGDDARQGDYCLRHFDISAVPYVEPGYYTTASDEAKRRAIRRFDHYVDGIFALNPDLMRVLPERARFQPYASVDPAEWTSSPRNRPEVPLLVHAPTHRGVKGTQFVIDAVSRLRDEGLRFDFQLVEGLTHAEAVRLYEKADLLVDQLLVGWYGALAVEFMAMGKPVVSYLRNDDLGFLPEGMRRELPVMSASPVEIADVLRSALTEPPQRWRERGADGRRFAEAWHDPRRIAADLKRAYVAARAARRHPRGESC
jgi:hypothetical protein